MFPRHFPLLIPLLFLLPLLPASTWAAESPPSLYPCKRQPFRGRCPAGPNGVQMRSQFVLRYYLRNGECISYPYGHCVNDEDEPRLYRYKEECEDACMARGGKESGGTKEATYATIGPIPEEKTTVSSEKAKDIPRLPMPECQRQRNAGARQLVQGGFVPECTDDGQFRPLQCEPSGEECFCVDGEGIERKHSRAKGAPKPDCERIASAQAVLVQECVGPADAGFCTGSIQRWHFDQQAGQCRPFNYSGCAGNGNNFGSEKTCSERCLGQAKCDGGQLPLKDSQGMLVDCSTANCPGGFLCQANAICCPELAREAVQPPKSPATEELAGSLISDKSAERDFCALPKDRGPCDQYQMRFYFNRELGECKYFFYGGCEGNANNFPRVEDCERACLPGKAAGTEHFQLAITSSSAAPTSSSSPSTITTISTSTERRTTAEERRKSSPVPLPPRDFVDLNQPDLDLDLTPPPPPPAVPQPSRLPSNRCQHPKDSGSCAAEFVRWSWNSEARICETFAYSGCGGNGNNFASREECLGICHAEVLNVEESVDPSRNVCDSEIDPGQCGGIFMRYGFDRKAGECRQFQYGGCGGNGNNFASLADCRRKCLDEQPGGPERKDQEEEEDQGTQPGGKKPLSLSPNICEHRMDPGECSGTFQRFGYDQQINRCTKFLYGGCGGNGNNFATLEDCSAACVRVQCPPEPECDLGRCQLVRDGQGCALCSCPPPPARHPPLAPTPPSPEGHAPQCPALNVQLCQEPCIIFLNRRGCRECVCPLMPMPSPQPSPAESISMPKHPQSRPLPPRVPQTSVSPPAPPAPPAPKIIQGLPLLRPSPNQCFSCSRGVSNNAVEALPPPTIAPSTAAPPPPPPLPSASPLPLPAQTAEPIAFGHNEICSQPLDPGATTCTRFVQRWFFNAESGQCEPFSYTGCAGNRNHFFSKKECQIYCARFSRNMANEGVPEGEQSTAAQPPPPLPEHAPPPPPHVPVPIPHLHELPPPMALPKPAPPPPSPSPVPVPDPFQAQLANQLPVSVEAEDHLEPETRAPMILQPIDPNVRLESRIVPEMGGRREVEGELAGPHTAPTAPSPAPAQTRAILRIGTATESQRTAGTAPSTVPSSTSTPPLTSTSTSSPSTTTTTRTSSEPSTSTSGTFTIAIPEENEAGVPKAREMTARKEEEEEGPLRTRLEIHSIQIPQRVSKTERREEEEGMEEQMPVTIAKMPEIIEAREEEEKAEEKPMEEEKPKKEEKQFREEKKFREEEKPREEMEPREEERPIEREEAIQPELPTIVPIAVTEPTFSTSSTNAEPLTSQKATKLEEEMERTSPEEEETSTPDDRMWVEGRAKEEAEEKEKQNGGGHSTLSSLFTAQHVRTEQVVDEEEELAPPQKPLESSESREEEREKNGTKTVESTSTQLAKSPEITTSPAQQLVPLNVATTSSSPSSSTAPPPPAPSPAVPRGPPLVRHISLPARLSPAQVCALPPDAGPCQQFISRWFFNSLTGQCEQFSFGSCRGNPNNFPDRLRCESTCQPISGVRQNVASRCHLEKEEGSGGGYNVHWYFNGRNLRCEQFVWQGQGGNGNRFGTEAECRLACGEQGQAAIIPSPANIVPPRNLVENAVGGGPSGEENNRVEWPAMVQKGAAIAQTRDSRGQVGMPAQAQAIPEMAPPPPTPAAVPSPEPSSAVPVPAPSPPPQQPSGYSALPLPKVPPKMPANLPPMLGNSPPATIDYVNKKRLDGPDSAVAHGLPNHVPETGKFDEIFGNTKDGGLLSFGPKQQAAQMAGMPVCPNGLNAMQYSDGRPVLCLPGMGQCPDKSVCFFNGLDFFCCPNEDDPYDQHVFGGYDGEESKHGYKVGGGLRARLRRQAEGPLSLAALANSLRFDDKPPPAPQAQARFQADSPTSVASSSSPCEQPLQKGGCQQANLRFFYEADIDRCRPFYFSGCDGNQNNFGTLAECERSCKRGSTPPPSTVPRGPCPGSRLPLGGRNPVLCGEQLDSIGCPSGFLCVPGPPSVCCPALTEAEIRRKPSIAEPGQMEVQSAEEHTKPGTTSIAEMNAHLLLCPDGSDPMRNGTSASLVTCGAGVDIDGLALCEAGFYCSIDPERNVRFCCPLQTQGAKLGTGSGELFAPHFGRRTANPGEVLGKGSLPSDQRTRKMARHGSNEFGHLRLRASRLGKEKKTGETAKMVESKAGLDWPTNEDPFEGTACLEKPSEGRACSKEEPNPHSNLQYFFSSSERRCKVFFHRGCGGNGNRFETKEECEKKCKGRR